MSLKRILVRLPGAKLGDFLMTTPALAGLRQAHPQAHITLLLWPPKPGLWLEGHPLFDATLWDDQAGAYRGPSGTLRLLNTIRAEQFDASVSLHAGSRYAWLFRFAKIPQRIGGTGKYYRHLHTLNIHPNRFVPDRHEVEYNFDLMRPLGVTGSPGPMVFPISAEQEAEAERLLTARGWSGEPFVTVNPTHGGSSRRWPESYFAEAARRITAETGARIVLTGTTGDRECNARVAAAIGPQSLDLTGDTGVGVLSAVLKRSALHISVDTGTSHLAAAQRVPCVTIFPASQHWDQRLRWTPWKTEQRIVGPTVRCAACRPYACNRAQSACLESITPEMVVRAALDLFDFGTVQAVCHQGTTTSIAEKCS